MLPATLSYCSPTVPAPSPHPGAGREGNRIPQPQRSPRPRSLARTRPPPLGGTWPRTGERPGESETRQTRGGARGGAGGAAPPGRGGRSGAPRGALRGVSGASGYSGRNPTRARGTRQSGRGASLVTPPSRDHAPVPCGHALSRVATPPSCGHAPATAPVAGVTAASRLRGSPLTSSRRDAAGAAEGDGGPGAGPGARSAMAARQLLALRRLPAASYSVSGDGDSAGPIRSDPTRGGSRRYRCPRC